MSYPTIGNAPALTVLLISHFLATIKPHQNIISMRRIVEKSAKLTNTTRKEKSRNETKNARHTKFLRGRCVFVHGANQFFYLSNDEE